MTEKINFITGGRGYLGGNLATELTKRGEFVKLLNRPGSSVPDYLTTNPKIEIVSGDILDRESLSEHTKNVDAIYHLAAFAKPWAKDNATYFQVNVIGTTNVLEAAYHNEVKNIVITSSAGTFGPQKDEKLIDESFSPQNHFTEYESTKQRSINESLKFIDRGLDIKFVSPTRVFGPGALSISNAVTRLIMQYWQGKFRFMPGDGYSTGNYAFINDVVDGHIAAQEKGKSGHNYILGGENISYREFFNYLAEQKGKSHKMIKLPIRLMVKVARGMELAAETTGKPPLITPGFAKKYMHNWGTDLSKAKNEIGYEVTPFKKALTETVNWLKAENLIR
ncbi:NAD-dependent epimerase/dehydratase family protein [Salibacter sp.]|uniref:NAD-dependent epimerase/dehydratase family protein n=1 Tax=Salibacter sp. TaxID=2010995 RepID=UPI0028709B87|nr:NAD-dependent epimerase/dehydratase family protein [Salibacter sp.]MDR9399567.1 NAD-dependent epimerase/dehydratase family protein [Salibacter sp.]MDR9488238.1 NAD-dependent epimerase/dehydratase family protein [Salibacter sp.]